jgi:hypothetical protein
MDNGTGLTAPLLNTQMAIALGLSTAKHLLKLNGSKRLWHALTLLNTRITNTLAHVSACVILAA